MFMYMLNFNSCKCKMTPEFTAANLPFRLYAEKITDFTNSKNKLTLGLAICLIFFSPNHHVWALYGFDHFLFILFLTKWQRRFTLT